MVNLRETILGIKSVVSAITEKPKQFSHEELKEIEREAAEMIKGLPGLLLEDAIDFCKQSRISDRLLTQRQDNQ